MERAKKRAPRLCSRNRGAGLLAVLGAWLEMLERVGVQISLIKPVGCSNQGTYCYTSLKQGRKQK